MRGVVACAALALAASACSAGTVEIDSPTTSGPNRAVCEHLLEDLPGTVADQERREVTPDDVLGAAWGSPPITLACGVDRPENFDEFATCIEADGVGWYVPDAALEDESIAVPITAVGYRPMVSVLVPAGYRPEGLAAAMAQLADPVRNNLELVLACR